MRPADTRGVYNRKCDVAATLIGHNDVIAKREPMKGRNIGSILFHASMSTFRSVLSTCPLVEASRHCNRESQSSVDTSAPSRLTLQTVDEETKKKTKQNKTAERSGPLLMSWLKLEGRPFLSSPLTGPARPIRELVSRPYRPASQVLRRIPRTIV